SDILELNRNSLVEGNSFIITLSKNLSENENRFKRINVKKIASLKDLFNKPISTIDFNTNKTSQINKISSLIKKKGLTEVKIKVKDKDNELVFKLKNKRLVDRKSINSLKNQDISTIIH
nr:DNA polymerase III subunit alpha [Pelagibacterales bacterium]